ncbi:MAG: peptidoglycan DD-metalloendopeptidase family protein [Clostridia bacterium]|nr:peptidoglycan DD-metalloendopeptidase family protein [Clostridia bacterium]
MKKIFLLISVLAMVIMFSGVVLATNLNTLKDQLDQNNKDLKDKQGQVTEIKNEQKTLLSQIANLGTQINKLETQIKALNNQINTCDAEITLTEEEIAEKEAEMEKQYNLLKTRIVAMYESGNISMIDVLLGADSISDFLSKYYMMNEVSNFDNNLLNKMNIQKEEIAKLKSCLEEKKTMLEKNRDDVKTKNTELASSKKVLSTKNSELENDKKALEESIDAIVEESQKLTAEIIKLQGTSKYAGGEMAWPLPGFSTITSSYGMRMHPTLKVYKLHTGVDISGANSYGKAIVAANSGKVIAAKYNVAYGNMIIIDHGGGITTLYGHASKLVVKTGDIVTRGQIIAYVGTTGYSTGPHLHFEVRKTVNGQVQTVDPMKYIK